MRRFVLVFLMLLLPLQWSWAAAASVCEHEGRASHFGHHEHKHQGAPEQGHADTDQHDHDKSPDGQSTGSHPDCQVCHGISAGFPQDADAPGLWPSADVLPAYAGVLPEPPVESFLRPPLPLVA